MTEFYIRAARDGGFYVRSKRAEQMGKVGDAPIVFAGDLDDCLSYLRRRLGDLDPEGGS